MFETITERLQGIFARLRSRGRLTEKDVDEAMREVRMALLEADVSYKVVKDFVAQVAKRAAGQEVLRNISPGQQVIKIVADELEALMGPEAPGLAMAPSGPTVIMLVGLQGSGKTTTAGKLARLLAERGRKPLMVAADVQRPAAIEQLKVLGGQLDVPVYSQPGWGAARICAGALDYAALNGRDTLLLDTAGRLHVDDALMAELAEIASRVAPHEILFVCDAMTGQDAVNSAKAFNDRLAMTGVILTKLDGDARGGAALSVKSVTGKPIKFVGVGEKLDKLEEFHPDRMAGRILGMGDVVSLVERAQAAVDHESAAQMQKKLLANEWTLEDFLTQIDQINKMGPIQELLGMIPGLGMGGRPQLDDGQLTSTKALIQSMTPQERRHPEIVDGSRRRRIAAGSGASAQAVNALLKQYKTMKRVMGRGGIGQMAKMMGATVPAMASPHSATQRRKKKRRR